MAIKTLMGDCPACCAKLTSVSAPLASANLASMAASQAKGVVTLANGDSYSAIPAGTSGSRSI
ncbi:MAG: hypothetical protein K2Q01_04265 [Rickettsiales bacterium]|nr:hypothetical protein [Rickettsiales bacterium]